MKGLISTSRLTKYKEDINGYNHNPAEHSFIWDIDLVDKIDSFEYVVTLKAIPTIRN